MSTLLDKLKRLLLQKTESSTTIVSATPDASQGDKTTGLNPEALQQLMLLVNETHEGEYNCAETFDLLDEYVDLVVDDADVAALMPLVQRHLEHCAGCQEQYRTLLAILQDPPTAAG